MTTQQLLQKLSNEMYHDFEKALESAKTVEEEEFWEGKIEKLEAYIAVLHSAINVECA